MKTKLNTTCDVTLPHRIYECGRGVGRRNSISLTISQLLQIHEERKKSGIEEPIKVLLVAPEGNLEPTIRKFDRIQSFLKNHNIPIVIQTDTIGSIGSIGKSRLEHSFDKFGVDFGYGESITVERLFEIKKPEYFEKFTTQIKSNKRGENNHSGSKFHK
jgi:hypothetical protein